MKIIFISGVYPKGNENALSKLCRSGSLEYAANTFQWGIIEGLADNQCDFEVISFPFLPGYPIRFKKLITPSLDIAYKERVIGHVFSYNAFFLLKSLSVQMRLKYHLNRWLKKNYSLNDEIWLLSYTPCSSFSNPIINLKKRYPKLKYCTIIADLVDDATNPVFHLSLPKLIQAKAEQRSVWRSYRYIDKFVLLSKGMEEKIEQAKGHSIVVEGLASKVDNEPVPIKTDETKTILYTGTLQDFTGIEDLIKAFKATINDNYRLVICGSGPLSKMIQEASRDDIRIIFKGSLPREEAVSLQKSATLLVNPRKPTVSLTRYSFPSKTMEYMASGTPMLGYKLDGIPEEYYAHMFVPDNLTIESLTDTINKVLSLPPGKLQEFGCSAKEFIRNNKEAARQVHRIIDFLKS